MSAATKLPATWHNVPEDSFHGKITAEGPFTPDKGRYHLYIGLFCPFAHRANLMLHLKQLNKYADIDVSVVKPYPKGDEGWRFNVKGEPAYEGATEDPLYGARFLSELYFKADPNYKGKYTVPVLWDKKLETIVNTESHELLRDLSTAFNTLLPEPLASLTLYPEQHRATIDRIEKWMQSDLNTGVYKTGFAPSQEPYEKALPGPFAALNADPRVMEHFPSTLTRERSDAIAARIREKFDRQGFGFFAVELPGRCPFIGFVGLSVPSFAAHFIPAVEIG